MRNSDSNAEANERNSESNAEANENERGTREDECIECKSERERAEQ